MKRISFEAKFSADASVIGAFSGYASTFGNVDRGGDVVVPGAFKSTLAEMREKGRPLPMLMQHGMLADPRPVGVWDSVEEDEIGLKVSGRLVGLETETGKYNYALIKEGAMRGLSIGYSAFDVDFGQSNDGPCRILKGVKLYEISIVDSPMNLAARITGVKSAGDIDEIKTLAEAESFLREAGEDFWTRRTACEFVSRVKRIAQGEPGGDGQSAEVALLKSLRAVRSNLIQT